MPGTQAAFKCHELDMLLFLPLDKMVDECSTDGTGETNAMLAITACLHQPFITARLHCNIVRCVP